eukprot:SAG31_NODE_6903_length_1857_cov_1.667235_1_plen_292_part_10
MHPRTAAATATSLGPIIDRLQQQLQQERAVTAKAAGKENKKKTLSLQKVHKAETAELTEAVGRLQTQVADTLNRADVSSVAEPVPPQVTALLAAAVGSPKVPPFERKPLSDFDKMADLISEFTSAVTDIIRQILSCSGDIVETGGVIRTKAAARLASQLLCVSRITSAWREEWELRYKNEPAPGGAAQAAATRAAWQKEEDSRVAAENLDSRAAELAAELAAATAAEDEEALTKAKSQGYARVPQWMLRDLAQKAQDSAKTAALSQNAVEKLSAEIENRQKQRAAEAQATFR